MTPLLVTLAVFAMLDVLWSRMAKTRFWYEFSGSAASAVVFFGVLSVGGGLAVAILLSFVVSGAVRAAFRRLA